MSNPAVVHSKLSFSARERWRACPISVPWSVGMFDSSSPAASEGTCAHTVAEFYVRQHFALPGHMPGDAADQLVPDGLDLKGKTPEQWNAQLRQHGKDYRDFIVSLIPAGEQAFVSVEMRVKAATISPDLFGTLDLAIWMPRLRALAVVDYKYGFMEVDVGTIEDTNAQLAAYAVAALDQCTLEAQYLTFAVFQPRRTFGTVAPRLDINDAPTWLAAERAKLAREVQAVAEQRGPFAGPHCRYCKAKSKCPTTHNAISAGIQTAQQAFDVMAIPDDALLDLWAAKTAFKALWEDIEERVDKMVKAGNPRLEVKESKGRQMWADEKAAALTLMALGKPELLRPCNVSDALPLLPEDWQKSLIRRSAPSRSIRLVTEVAPAQIAATFAKYAKPLDTK